MVRVASTTPRSVLASVALLALVITTAACGSSEDDAAPGSTCFDPPDIAPVAADPDGAVDAHDGTTVRVLTHSAFAVSSEVVEDFEARTGIRLQFIEGADAGSVVSQAILTRENPVADVIFGVDNTFLCRALEADLFVPYESPLLGTVDADLRIDPHLRVTPIDYGDVCVNWWAEALDASPPASLDDLRRPELASTWVTMNPETSSPGLAMLLGTVAAYGEDWADFWRDARAGGVSVTSGWTDAYFGEFVAGGGSRAIVTSYATSPVAEVLFADPPVGEPPTRVLTDGCFRQIEFAGIVAGTDVPQAAGRVIDFMLSQAFQEDIPLQMFVFPASSAAELPEVFRAHALAVDDALVLDPADIEANRDRWIDEWYEIVVR